MCCPSSYSSRLHGLVKGYPLRQRSVTPVSCPRRRGLRRTLSNLGVIRYSSAERGGFLTEGQVVYHRTAATFVAFFEDARIEYLTTNIKGPDRPSCCALPDERLKISGGQQSGTKYR